MIGCLRTRVRVRKQPIIAFYFESENELTFYNLEAWVASVDSFTNVIENVSMVMNVVYNGSYN